MDHDVATVVAFVAEADMGDERYSGDQCAQILTGAIPSRSRISYSLPSALASPTYTPPLLQILRRPRLFCLTH